MAARLPRTADRRRTGRGPRGASGMKVLPPLLALAALGILLAGCLGRVGVPGGYTKQDLEKQPEARLAFPGATLLSTTSSDPVRGIEGQEYASVTAEFGTSATPGEVEAF